MEAGRIRLSVIIVSYNTRELLARCLASIAAEPQPPDEVIVVDNASADDSVVMVREQFPHVQVIANAENRGFAAATNQGLQSATGDFLCLLNPDTELFPGALAALAAFLAAHAEVGVAGPTLLHTDGTYQHAAFRFPTLPMALIDFFPLNHRLLNSRLNGRYPFRLYEHPFAMDHPLGACMMVRREACADVGLLDERFFMYCEEIDWCRRIKQADWEIMHVPGARVVHHGGQSTKQTAGRMFVELHRSRFRLFAKHHGRGYQCAARAIVTVGMLWQLIGLLPQRVRHFRDQILQDRWRSRLQVLALALKGEN
ncbi:MAG: glycosyltransferase family 2 protein [Chloroflexi bacterium]|nr:glycosyltransferase family 2 protein [Chloroflexota bacterium]